MKNIGRLLTLAVLGVSLTNAHKLKSHSHILNNLDGES